MQDPRTVVPDYPTAANERSIDLAAWSRTPRDDGPSPSRILIGAAILGAFGGALVFVWPRSKAPPTRAIPRSQETS